MSAKLTVPQPLKWHGGKGYMAKDIVTLMPLRASKDNPSGWLHYVEPFAGGLAVLLQNDPEGISEVVNDKHRDLTNFWSVLSVWSAFVQFKQMAEATPFAEHFYRRSFARLQKPWASPAAPSYADDLIERAHAFFVVCRQSLSGRMKGFTGITRTRVRRGMNNEVSAWLSCIEGLPAVHARLKRVLILNRDALDVIRKEDGPQTLFYLDPPYLHETRATTTEYGEHEMTREQHSELLALLVKIKGRFLLSGYRSDAYDAVGRLNGWKRHDFELANQAAGGKTKRRMTECVWTNY